MFKKLLLLLTIILTLVSFNTYAASIQVADDDLVSVKKEVDPKNSLYIELKDGIVIVELFPNKAPLHVQRIRTLTQDGFYNGLKFHRVIAGFMAQTGDPTGTGRGGSSLGKLYAEFNDEHHTRGTLSMARASDPNSANSQFFIVTGEFFPELEGQYTIFGRVVEGMEYVDKVKVGDTANNGMVENPDVMIRVVTGDMINNKSIEVIKQEIEIINQMQADKKKEDPQYQNKSVLELLLQTRDINISEVEAEPAQSSTVEEVISPNSPTPQLTPNGAPRVPTPTTPGVPLGNTTNTTPSIQNARPAGTGVQNNTRTRQQIEQDVSNQMGSAVKDTVNEMGMQVDQNTLNTTPKKINPATVTTPTPVNNPNSRTTTNR